MALVFEWDESKAQSNAAKHGVSFDEAASVFGDPLSLSIDDPEHSRPAGDRYVTVGLSLAGRLIVVVHSDRSDHIRIVSARVATPRERLTYEEDA
jgi:uncharacterized DUF497 family protein